MKVAQFKTVEDFNNQMNKATEEQQAQARAERQKQLAIEFNDTIKRSKRSTNRFQ